MRIAFKILTLALILALGTGYVSFAQKNNKDKGDKRSKQEEKDTKFIAVKKLIENRNFVFDAERAFPTNGQSIELGSNPGQIIVRKDMAYAGLPYIGESHTTMYGTQNVGMNFEGKMKNVKMKVNEKKRKLYFSFSVSKDDVYDVSMEISYNGGCSVTIISQKKSSISYNGSIAEYEE